MIRPLLLLSCLLLASCRTAPPPPPPPPIPPPKAGVLTVRQAVLAANRAAKVLRLPAGTKQAARAFPWTEKLKVEDILKLDSAVPEGEGPFIVGGSFGWLPISLTGQTSGKGSLWGILLTQPSPGGQYRCCSVTLLAGPGIRTERDLLAFLRGNGPRSARIHEAAISRPDKGSVLDYYWGRGNHTLISNGASLPPNKDSDKVRPLSDRPLPVAGIP